MSFLNPDLDILPVHVQAVLDGTYKNTYVFNPPYCCSKCRVKDASIKMLRCSRCQVAHYCSIKCQKKHFSFHKFMCKYVFTERQQVEEMQKDVEPNLMALADALVTMGYRETDTIVNGSVYYRRALSHYLELLKVMQGNFLMPPPSPLEDKVLMLLMLLGGDSKIMLEWCHKTGSPRFANFMPPTTVEAPPQSQCQFQTQGLRLAANDLTFQALCLLASMRSLAEYRRDEQGLAAYQQRARELATTRTVHDRTSPGWHPICERPLLSLISSFLLGSKNEQGQIHMEILPNEIRLLVSAIRYHGNASFLRHLRDTIPFSLQQAPDLLDAISTPPEFWYLFQDCFFLTPGLNDILHEFVPEEDDDDVDSDEEEDETENN